MTAVLAARLIAGAFAGSIVLTRAEVLVFYRDVPEATAVIVDGNPVLLHALPLHVLPNSVDQLAEADQ